MSSTASTPDMKTLRSLTAGFLAAGPEGQKYPCSLGAMFDREEAPQAIRNPFSIAAAELKDLNSKRPNRWRQYERYRKADARSFAEVMEREELFSVLESRLLPILPRCRGRDVDQVVALLVLAGLIDENIFAGLRISRREPYHTLLKSRENRTIFLRALARAIVALDESAATETVSRQDSAAKRRSEQRKPEDQLQSAMYHLLKANPKIRSRAMCRELDGSIEPEILAKILKGWPKQNGKVPVSFVDAYKDPKLAKRFRDLRYYVLRHYVRKAA